MDLVVSKVLLTLKQTGLGDPTLVNCGFGGIKGITHIKADRLG